MSKTTTPSAIDAVLKKYGDGAILQGNQIVDVQRVKTGSLTLDLITGGGWGVGRIIEVYGPESSGKAQPLSAKILTPTGWKTMGDMEVGTIVCTPDGSTSTVVGVYPQGHQNVYEITLDDKSKTHCTLDHLWFVETRESNKGEVLTTAQLLARGLKTAAGTRKFVIPSYSPVYFDSHTNLPVDPYLLGLLLGDGGLTSGGVKISTADPEIVTAIKEILKKDYDGEVILGDPHSKYDYRFKKPYNGNSKCTLEIDLEKLGLMGKLSIEKRIPEEYLVADYHTRIALLQGLMDSDGTVSKESSSLSFSSSSVGLSKDFVQLSRSLGIRCNTSSKPTKYTRADGIKVDGKTAYRTNMLLTDDTDFLPFRLKRHIEKIAPGVSSHKGRFIESIELVGHEPCQCIAIGSEDRLYITDDYIVTHNTTLAIHSMIEAQKAFPHKKILVVDTEHALDRKYCEKLGLDMSKVYVTQPDNGEQALDIAEDMISTGEFSFVLVDSVATLLPKSELEGEMGDSAMGSQARLMSKGLRKLAGITNTTKTILFFTNQLRSKIGVIYGNPEITSGGNALKFYASIRVDIRKKAGDAENGEIKDIKVTCKTVKNKLAPPFKSCTFNIRFGQGIDRTGEVLSVGEYLGIIEKKGNTYMYDGTKLGVGVKQARTTLDDNPELLELIANQVMLSMDADLDNLETTTEDLPL
jgi:recombination protein RecA